MQVSTRTVGGNLDCSHPAHSRPPSFQGHLPCQPLCMAPHKRCGDGLAEPWRQPSQHQVPRALPLRHRAHRTAPGLMHIDTRQSVKKTDTPFRTSASPSKRLAHSGTIQLKKAPCFHGALVKRVTLYAGVTPRRRSSLTLASREAHAQQAEAKQTQRCRL